MSVYVCFCKGSIRSRHLSHLQEPVVCMPTVTRHLHICVCVWRGERWSGIVSIWVCLRLSMLSKRDREKSPFTQQCVKEFQQCCHILCQGQGDRSKFYWIFVEDTRTFNVLRHPFTHKYRKALDRLLVFEPWSKFLDHSPDSFAGVLFLLVFESSGHLFTEPKAWDIYAANENRKKLN